MFRPLKVNRSLSKGHVSELRFSIGVEVAPKPQITVVQFLGRHSRGAKDDVRIIVLAPVPVEDAALGEEAMPGRRPRVGRKNREFSLANTGF